MSVTNRLEEWMELFSLNRARVDITSAAAAGGSLSVAGLVLLKASMLGRVDPLEVSGIARLVLMTTMSYLIAGLIIYRLWLPQLRRRIPSWIMIALLGSSLLVVSAGAFSFYTKTVASNAPLTMFVTVAEFVRDKAKDGLSGFIVLSLFTLPVTAAVYYAPSIVRACMRWYIGDEPASIFGNRRT